MSLDIVIEFKNASIFQKEVLVLSGVDMTIGKGEFVYLIGKTGSGKSSLLQTVYADLPLAYGDATVVGYDLKKIRRKEIPFLRRRLGIIFQDFQLLTDRSVTDNLLFVMKATGWKDKKKMQEQAQDVLEKVGLGTKGFKMPHQLSGGEQQRVAIARALVNNPEIILADEPTGNLDPKTSWQIMKIFKKIEKKKTIIIATHNTDIVDSMQKRVIHLDKGKIRKDSKKGGYSL